MREHLEQVWKSTGRKPEGLDPPPFPDVVNHVWAWFIELHNARPQTGMGVSPITYSEISAWSSLTGVIPNPWEVGVIKSIDRVFITVNSKKGR